MNKELATCRQSASIMFVGSYNRVPCLQTLFQQLILVGGLCHTSGTSDTSGTSGLHHTSDMHVIDVWLI